MGRCSIWGEPEANIHLHRIDLKDGGYDEGGAYWGLGLPLFHAFDEEENLYAFLRAENIKAAKKKILESFPNAKILSGHDSRVNLLQSVIEFKILSDPHDKYGEAMELLFCASAELSWRGEYVLWEYSPGACDDPREPDSAYFTYFKDESTENLQRIGLLFDRYLDFLKLNGYGY